MKTKIIIVAVVVAVLIGAIFIINKTKMVNTPEVSGVVYTNSDYGFTFTLPENWKGYTVVNNTWEGNSLNNSTTNESGPKILIRNPNWQADAPYEDIPILVFTKDQWAAYVAEGFAVSAAPIPATEFSRNNHYVFALPPRWDFDYSLGYEEAQNIVNSNPLQAFDIEKVAILQDGRQCYTYNHEATTTEPYKVDEFIDITISGTKVSGSKKGTQAGPDMTNGYTGTINGTLTSDTIESVFAYTIEGSQNKESEIYKARKDEIGIEKLRYPLIEKGGMLVPDTTQDFKTLLYARVGCTGSN